MTLVWIVIVLIQFQVLFLWYASKIVSSCIDGMAEILLEMDKSKEEV